MDLGTGVPLGVHTASQTDRQTDRQTGAAAGHCAESLPASNMNVCIKGSLKKGCPWLLLKMVLVRNLASNLAPPCVLCITDYRPEQMAVSQRLPCGGKANGSDVLWAGLLTQELQKEARELNGTILTWASLLG